MNNSLGTSIKLAKGRGLPSPTSAFLPAKPSPLRSEVGQIYSLYQNAPLPNINESVHNTSKSNPNLGLKDNENVFSTMGTRIPQNGAMKDSGAKSKSHDFLAANGSSMGLNANPSGSKASIASPQSHQQKVVFMRSLPDSLALEKCSLVYSTYLYARSLNSKWAMFIPRKLSTSLFRLDGNLLVCLDSSVYPLSRGSAITSADPFGTLRAPSRPVQKFKRNREVAYPRKRVELSNILLAVEAIYSEGPDVQANAYHMPKWSIPVSEIKNISEKVPRPSVDTTSQDALTFLIYTRHGKCYECHASTPSEYHRWTYLLVRMTHYWSNKRSLDQESFLQGQSYWHDLVHDLIAADGDECTAASFSMIGWSPAKGVVGELGAGSARPAPVHSTMLMGVNAPVKVPSPKLATLVRPDLASDASSSSSSSSSSKSTGSNGSTQTQSDQRRINAHLKEIHELEAHLLSLGIAHVSPATLPASDPSSPSEPHVITTPSLTVADADSYHESLVKMKRASARFSVISQVYSVSQGSSDGTAEIVSPTKNRTSLPLAPASNPSTSPVAARFPAKLTIPNTELQSDLVHCLNAMDSLLTRLTKADCTDEWRDRLVNDCIPYFQGRICTLLRVTGNMEALRYMVRTCGAWQQEKRRYIVIPQAVSDMRILLSQIRNAMT